MKPIRNKGNKFRSSLRKTLRRAAKPRSVNHKLVEVCELSADRTMGSTFKKSELKPSLQSCAKTPLGSPSRKRPRWRDSQPPPLDLSPVGEGGTEVIVVNTSFQDDSGRRMSPLPPGGDVAGSTLGLNPSEMQRYGLSDNGPVSPGLEQHLPNGQDVPDGPALHDRLPSKEDKQVDGGDGVQEYLLFQLKPPTSYLLLLHGGTKIPVRGRAKIRSLFGTLTVLGFDITPERGAHTPLYCPTNGISFPCLETSSSQCRDLTTAEKGLLQENLGKLRLDKDATEILLSSMRSDSVLLHVSRLDDRSSSFITGHQCHKYLYTAGSARKVLQKRDVKICDKVGFFLNTQETNVFEALPGYDDATRYIQEMIATENESPRIMFIGRKNSGKSTSLRYIINRLQSIGTDVCYLECDPGQSEFTAPAILSLHVIKQPLLGPPFTHLNEPVKSYFLGDVNAADHKCNYRKMINALYREYAANFSHLPLFINTMGWVEGLGLDLLRDLARSTQPTLMVEMVSQDEKRIQVFESAEHDNGSRCIVSEQPSLPPWKCLQIEAKSQSDSIHASSQRELNLLSALSRLLELNPDAKGIASVQPRVIPWSQVYIHVCHASVPASQLLYAINASIVGLCTTSPEQLQKIGAKEEENGLRILTSAPVSECHGIGIIRGIDPEKRLIYILPAVPSGILPMVNTLLMGSPPIPECMLMQQGSASSGAPYISDCFDVQVCGSQPVKPKTYLKRGPGTRSVKF